MSCDCQLIIKENDDDDDDFVLVLSSYSVFKSQECQ